MARESVRALLEPLDRVFRTGTLAGESDRHLLERFLSRHDEFAEAAFEALVLRHGPMVLRVCRRLLNDPNDADDAFQATFLVLVRKAGSVRKCESVAGWLYRVARRIAVHARAAEVRRSAVERRAGARLASTYEPRQADREIWDEVDRLPRKLRMAVILCYLEGLTHEEAAVRLSWPVGTIRSRLARARAQLRARLGCGGLASEHGLLPMLAFETIRVPDRLINPLIKFAMLIGAGDAAQAGLVSASVASLTQGALFAMSIAKLQSAAAMLITAGFLACGAAYAYQDSSARPNEAFTEPRPASIGPAPRFSVRLEDRELSEVRRDEPESFSSRIVELAIRARERQEKGEIGSAVETLTQVQRLAGQWRETLLRESERREEPKARESRPGRTNSSRVVEDTGGRGASSSRAVGGTEGRGASADIERRLDELERMMRQVMRVLEADRRRVESGEPPKADRPRELRR